MRVFCEFRVQHFIASADRRNVKHDWSLDPASFRRQGGPGDFELESLKLEDVLITIYQPHFRPYNASIFRAEVHRLRQQWLFYDLLSAENVVGQWDNCLFSVHKPQSIGRTTQEDTQDGRWNRMVRFILLHLFLGLIMAALVSLPR